MKIAILQDELPSEIVGGAGVVALDLAKGLRRRNHDVFIICATRDKKPEYEEKDGLRIYNIKTRPFGFLKYYLCLYNPAAAPKIRAIFEKEKPDVAHCHNLHAALSYHSLKIAKKFSKKVFITAHDAMMFNYGKLAGERYVKNFDCRASWAEHIKIAGKQYNPLRNILIKHYLLKYADKIFVVSRALESALNQNGIKNTKVIYNGADMDFFRAKEGDVLNFKKRHNLEGKKIIFFAARISREKGPEWLLRAMPHILSRIPDAVLLIIGGGNESYIKNLKETAIFAGSGDSVLFLGQTPYKEIKTIYFAADVAVTPSVYLDPFNLTNIEAMAAKKPVVGTCYGGTPEIIVHGETGYIVNPLNVDEMAEKIIAVLSDERLAEKLGSAGYQRVKEKFSLDKQIEKLLEYYNF